MNSQKNQPTEIEVANKIKDGYITKPITKLYELKALDKKVKKPAKVFAYIFGVLGSLVLGTGMCFAMKVLGDIMVVGIVVGILGILMVSINYPIYKAILKKRKFKYSRKILELSQEIVGE